METLRLDTYAVLLEKFQMDSSGEVFHLVKGSVLKVVFMLKNTKLLRDQGAFIYAEGSAVIAPQIDINALKSTQDRRELFFIVQETTKKISNKNLLEAFHQPFFVSRLSWFLNSSPSLETTAFLPK